MIKIFVLLLCFGIYFVANGQEIKIERSKEVVQVAGKSYYLHVVRPGQTLFSICKFYGVDIAEVRKLNGKQDNVLSVGEVLKIPFVQSFRQLDDKFYYHRMKPKETLYSLSRKFGVRLKRILKDNPNYNVSQPIATGAVVKLALKQIRRNVLEAELAWEKREALKQVQDQQVKAEEVSQVLNQEERQYVAENPDTLYRFIDNSMRPTKTMRVALLLPFYVQENKLPAEGEIETDSLGVNKYDESGRLYGKSEPFIQFYEGMLMAVDSLKKSGFQIDMRVYDTEKSVAKVIQLVGDLNGFAPDLIIGPVYSNTFEVLAERLDRKTVPMIFPLPARVNGVSRFSNAVVLNSSAMTLMEKMAAWIARQGVHNRILVIDSDLIPQKAEERHLIDRVRDSLSRSGVGMQTVKWHSGILLDSLKRKLDPQEENIVLLPTVKQAVATQVLPILSALSDDYKITVIGFPEWLKFTALDDEMFFKLNLKLFLNFRVDHNTSFAIDFSRKYWDYFASEPTHLAQRAFDIGMFFIPRVAENRAGWRENLLQSGGNGAFTRFDFKALPYGGLENCGFYLVHFGSDYQIQVIDL